MSFKLDLNPAMSKDGKRRLGYHSHEDDKRRPEISLDVDLQPYTDDCPICLTIGETLGHSLRWIELTADEARELSEMLKLIADNLEEHLAIKKAEAEEEAAQ